MPMRGGMSPYELLSQMRLSNYMSSPSFDRGMSQGPMGAGGGFGMGTPFMPSSQDVGAVMNGEMPGFQPMPRDNPLGQYAGQMNGRAVNSGPFGNHPMLQNALGNMLNFAGNFQQGETVGENIGGVARGLMGNFNFPRQAAMARFEGAFNVGNQLQELQQRKAMTDYYGGRGDYYELKNQTEQQINDVKEQGRKDIDAANNATKLQIEGAKRDAQSLHEHDWFQTQQVMGENGRLRAEAAMANAGASMTKQQTKMLNDAARDPEGKTPAGRFAHNWLNEMAKQAGNVAGSQQNAKDNSRGTGQFDRRADAHLKGQLLNPGDPKARESVRHGLAMSGGKLDDSAVDQEIARRNQFVTSTYQDWKKSFNPQDPYEFSAFLGDRRQQENQPQASPLPSSASNAPRSYDPVSGTIR